MSIQSHLLELKRRHAALDQEIARELASPAKDSVRVAELKRRKLVLKDEMNRLGETSTIH